MRRAGGRPGNFRVQCAAAAQHGSCAHTRTYNLAALEKLVIECVREALTDPKHLARFEKGFRSQYAKRIQPDNSAELKAIQRKLNQVTVQIDRVVNAIATMDTPLKQLTDKLDQLERERAGQAERLRLLEAEVKIIELHPNAFKAFRENLKQLLTMLSGTTVPPEAHAAFRMLFDTIVVHRTEPFKPYEITPYARIGGTLDANLSPPKRPSRQILEEEGVSRSDSDTTENAVASCSTV